MNGRDETVSVTPHSLDKVRVGSVVLQSRPEPADSNVEAQVSLDESSRPNRPDDLASRYQLLGAPKQKREYLEGLVLKGNSRAVAEQLSGSEIDYEPSKPETIRVSWTFHRSSPL
jgi:hypothetical protein